LVDFFIENEFEIVKFEFEREGSLLTLFVRTHSVCNSPSVGWSVHQLVDDGLLFLAGEFTELRIKEEDFKVWSPEQFKQSLNTFLGNSFAVRVIRRIKG